MELRQIKFFMAVAEEGHFGQAAKRMSIAQPALSRHLRRLERELEAELFDRSAGGARLTAAGEAFLEVARRVCRQVPVTVDLTDPPIGEPAGGPTAPRALQRVG
jgi:DNA-binding transcriptional LysR family regulator